MKIQLSDTIFFDDTLTEQPNEVKLVVEELKKNCTSVLEIPLKLGININHPFLKSERIYNCGNLTITENYDYKPAFGDPDFADQTITTIKITANG